MTDTPDWPFPDKPGVPLNPERDGWHWVCAAVGIAAPYPMLWSADGKAWDTGDGWEFCTSPRMTERTRYLGPCLTPQQVAAREAAAAEEMRAICARAAMVELGWNNGSVEARKAIAMQAAHTVNAIRERPIPSSDALAAALAQARRETLEEAAAWHDEQANYCSKRAAERMAEGHRSAFGVLKTVQATHENSAAAIRAKAQENTP